MKIKKFVAKSMPEAMKKIKEELGNDAIILNSKEVQAPGLFGLFRRKQIEVTAMLDETISKRPKEKERFSMPAPRPSRIPQMPVEKPASSAKESEILEEIKYLQSILAKQTVTSDIDFPPLLQHMYEYLLEQEVDRSLATRIVENIAEEIDKQDVDRFTLKNLLYNELQAQLADVPFHSIRKDAKVLQFVGPTGVGKTTTIAKVAAKLMLQTEQSVAFITADTYRIAAIEQLKTYATILNVPLEVVYSQEDYEKALRKFANYDVIFVDTAGRNYREDKYIKELEAFITTPKEVTETFLVLALTAKSSDLHDIYEQFKPLNIHRLIFTKVDETESYGSLLNLPLTEKVDIAYLTNGQNVPDDLLEANKKIITDLLISRYGND